MLTYAKTDKMNADVLIADRPWKIQFKKNESAISSFFLYGDLYSNFSCSIVPQISCIIQKI